MRRKRVGVLEGYKGSGPTIGRGQGVLDPPQDPALRASDPHVGLPPARRLTQSQIPTEFIPQTKGDARRRLRVDKASRGGNSGRV